MRYMTCIHGIDETIDSGYILDTDAQFQNMYPVEYICTPRGTYFRLEEKSRRAAVRPLLALLIKVAQRRVCGSAVARYERSYYE